MLQLHRDQDPEKTFNIVIIFMLKICLDISIVEGEHFDVRVNNIVFNGIGNMASPWSCTVYCVQLTRLCTLSPLYSTVNSTLVRSCGLFCPLDA